VIDRPGNPQGRAALPNGVPVILRGDLQLLDLLRRQHLGPAEQPATGYFLPCVEQC